MTSPTLTALHVYPVKSAAGATPDASFVEPWGLAADRRWMLAGPDGKQVTQYDHPRLALVAVEPLADGGVRLGAPGMRPLTVPVPGAGEAGTASTAPVEVWRTKVEAVPAAAEASAWFSAYLEAEVGLVHLDEPARRRPIAAEYASEGETVSFADVMPLLLTSASSLGALNSLIAQGDRAEEGPVAMSRFRPNAVIGGAAPWAEDGWRRIRIGEVVFRMPRSCGRCVVTTIDQTTAEQGKEPLRTLARHRRVGDRLVFGQYLVPETSGPLRVGDPVEVLDATGE